VALKIYSMQYMTLINVHNLAVDAHLCCVLDALDLLEEFTSVSELQ